MADIVTSANVQTLMQAADFSTFRTSLGLTALSTTTPGSGIATFLATPSSANLAAAVTGETGSGALVFGTSPAFTTNFTLANGASPTTSAVAQMAFDTDAWAASRGAVAVHDGTATTWLVGVLASDTPSNGQVPTWNTGGTITWETPSGTANGVTAASAAGSSGLFWVSAGADRTATATNTITTINATTANVTNLLPVSNDGAAVGASGTAFSDLFLASGAVINFNAGNYTLTHSAGVLTANLDFRVTTAGTNAASVATLAGAQSLSNKDIIYTVEPGADDTAYGDKLAGILAGDTIAQWDLVYLDSTSGRWELADSDAVATAGGVLLGLAVTSGTDGNALTVLLRGIVRNDGWTWASAGLKLYGSLTPGGLTVTQPSATDDVIRPIADTLSDDCIWFAPGQFWQTHT